MNKIDAPKSAEPFVSMLVMQEEYLRLSAEAEAIERDASTVAADTGDETILRNLVGLRRQIGLFERRATATGTILDENADRVLAQSMLDFWCLRQAYLQRLSNKLREMIGSERALPLLASAPRLRDPMRLAPFDEMLAPKLPDNPTPFVGLNAFGETEAANSLFFGRDEAINELKATLSAHRLVIVAGPSGSGKSSLVMAGLVPALRRGAVEGSAEWIYRPAVLPGADPFAALLQALRPAGRDAASWIAENRAALEKAPGGLAKLLIDADAPSQPSLLIVDQSEELLSMVADPAIQARFAAAIVAATRSKGPRHRVVIIVREDFLERLFTLDAFAGLPESSVTNFHPKPMTSAELRLAIEEPARAIGLKFDEGIVEDLVREVVNDPAALPLLQFTLAQLWRQRRRNRITHEAYAEVGRPAEALSRTAERVYEDLSTPENQDAAKDIFLALVVPSIGAEFVRRRVRREVLHTLRDSSRIDRVLEAFENAGLIRKIEGVEAADDRFDVMHEALLRNWERLTGWLEEKLRTSGRQLQVLNRARVWEESGREADHLAIGTAIAEAELFAENDLLIREYFEASRLYGEKRARQHRVFIAIAAFVLLVLAGAIITLVYNHYRDVALARQQTEVDAANARAVAADARAAATEKRRNIELATIQTLYKELIEAGMPMLRTAQSPPAAPRNGPGAWGVIWVGSASSPLISDPRNPDPVAPDRIAAYRLYRMRANLTLRADYPGGPEARTLARQSDNGTVAAGSLVIALEPPRAFDRGPVTQYWVKVRIIPRVIIRYPNGAANRAEIARIVGALRNAGYDAVAADPIPATQSASELRYFYAQDRTVANDLAARLGRLLDQRHPPISRVASIQSAVRPDPGTLELWLDPSIPSSE